MSIPSDISKVLLPQDDLNVVDLVDFTISKGTKSAPDLLVMQDSELFSKIASVITSEKHVAFLHSPAESQSTDKQDDNDFSMEF